MLHVEFIAFLLFIVYLGAIAVLFLFVIMMFNIHILESRDNIIRYLPMVIVLLLVIAEMCYITETVNFKLESAPLNELFFLHKN
jgi:NADH-quinone oxidoreductase subunit J